MKIIRVRIDRNISTDNDYEDKSTAIKLFSAQQMCRIYQIQNYWLKLINIDFINGVCF